MTKAKLRWWAAATVLSFPLSSLAASVPPATCRTTDRPETGISGETTADERDAGLPFRGFKCNADLVGQYQGEGASWQLTAWKNCAYFDQRHFAQGNNPPGGNPLLHPGVVVVDVSDPTNPVPTTWLNSLGMVDPWESVKVNPARQLLAGDQRPLNGSIANPHDGFSVYDISADCTQPVQKSDVHIAGSVGHTGNWVPDGKTYYVTPLMNTPSIIAVDVTDPTLPVGITGGVFTFSTDGGTTPQNLALSRLHDTEFSKDGNTAYVTMFGVTTTNSGNGIGIIDVSDFQGRKANPEYRVISQITWDDGSIGAQDAIPVTIGGKSYLITADEAGVGLPGCALNESANGFPRIIDISDPAHPQTVAEIRLGVADPANCAHIATAPITGNILPDGGLNAGPSFFAHSCHYCRVDNPDNAKLLACNCFAAGFRVFDIHDIAHITEIAYYKPPAQGTKALPGSQYANSNSYPGFVRLYDWATSQPSFPKDRGATSGDIWTTSQDNGFMVIHLASTVTVSPTTASVDTGKATNFNATVDGAYKNGGINWAVQETSGASITDAGVFTATTAGTYHVIASSGLDATRTAAATVTANAPAASSGCSAAPLSLSGLAATLFAVGWLLTRRRRQSE